MSDERMTDEQLKREFDYLVENKLKKPYAVMIVSDSAFADTDSEERILETFESFEECFEEAEEVWKNRNYSSFEIEEVMMVDSIHPSRFFPYFVFSNHFSDAERITKVMQMEKALYGNYNKKWLFEIMHFAINNDDEYAEKIFEKISKDVEEELIQLTEKKIAIKIPR